MTTSRDRDYHSAAEDSNSASRGIPKQNRDVGIAGEYTGNGA